MVQGIYDGTDMPSVLELKDITKKYAGSEETQKPAVDGVSLQIDAGEVLGLVGESGCGKTTLGRIALRLIEPDHGSVRFDGKDVLSASSTELRRLRREMQIVFQDPYGSLDPRMNIQQILEEPFVIHDLIGASGSAMNALLREKAGDLLGMVGLDTSALARYPHEFSGGQRQRIGIARALATKPKFLVADEPVSALDVSVAAQIVNLLARLQREFGLAMLFISHSMPVVRHLSDRIAVMKAGKVVEIGGAEELTAHPQHLYTRELLAAVPELAI